MSMVHIIAKITALPGKREEVLAAFNANRPAVLKEDGCIEYGAAIDAEGVGKFQTKFGDDTIIVIEKWGSLDALMAHAVSPHMKEYSTKTKDLLSERAIHVLSSA